MKRIILLIDILVISTICFAQNLSSEGKKHYKAAMTLFDMASSANDYKAVVQEFELVVNSDPNYADTYFNLGKIYTKLGKEYGKPYFQSAKDAYNRYKELKPEETASVEDELYALELVEKLFTKQRIEKLAPGFVDLGLPSGILWKENNEDGYYSYDQAIENFGNSVPSKEQFEELIKNCTWTYTGNGYKVTGTNGESIFLPAAGTDDVACGSRYGVWLYGQRGFYWSSTAFVSDCRTCAWHLAICEPSVFGDDAVSMSWIRRCSGHSIRLVKVLPANK